MMPQSLMMHIFDFYFSLTWLVGNFQTFSEAKVKFLSFSPVETPDFCRI